VEAKPEREVQRFTDSVVRKTLLWLFPDWIHPNHLTILRFVLIPVVLLLLHSDLRWWALGVFVVAVCTDFIDGTMARTRDQITPTGIIIDPIADKLLVGSVLAWVGWDYLVVKIILIFIAFELVLTAVGIGIARPGQRARPANAFGKGKMVVQSVALVLFLVASFLELDGLITVSLYMLWVAIGLAALSGITHVMGVSSAHRAGTKA
jgi:CDP-diacylglycerol--glycerol-3-phosphate 3-phosphatidyltransferase